MMFFYKRTPSQVIGGVSFGALAIGLMAAQASVIALVSPTRLEHGPNDGYTYHLWWLLFSLSLIASGILGLIYRKHPWAFCFIALPGALSALFVILVTSVLGHR
jgi:hypothetical protein